MFAGSTGPEPATSETKASKVGNGFASGSSRLTVLDSCTESSPPNASEVDSSSLPGKTVDGEVFAVGGRDIFPGSGRGTSTSRWEVGGEESNLSVASEQSIAFDLKGSE